MKIKFQISNFKLQKSGFTLIELLMVIAIIGVLATLAMAAVKYALNHAKISKAQSAINTIYKAIEMLGNDCNVWPGNQVINTIPAGPDAVGNEICGNDKNGNGCGAGLSDATSGLIVTNGNAGWSGPYMLKMPIDPWGHEYFFDTDYSVDIDNMSCLCGGGGCVNAVVIGSYGPDGEGVPDEIGGTPGSYSCDDIIKIITK